MEQTNDNLPLSHPGKAKILDLLNEYDKGPAMTIKAFCQLHQISEGSFYSARSRYRPAGASKQKPSSFIALGSPLLKGPAAMLFAEVNGIKLYQVVPADYLKALIV